MNERIKELIEEADRRCSETRGVFDEILAELIIKECASIAAGTPAPNFHDHLKQQLGHTWDMACVESARYIRQHFGISNES